jgi:P27 family predicted phage terminase small subunit
MPTALKIARGNPGKRPLNDREPQAKKIKSARAPAWLDDEARACWKRTTRELAGMGLLTSADLDALAAYCDAISQWHKAREFIAKYGDSYSSKDADGKIKNIIAFPQVSTYRNLLNLIRNYQRDFGLTPSARSSLHIVGKPEEFDPYEILLEKRMAIAG